MNHLKITVLLLGGTLTLSSCVTILGKKQTIHVDSYPQNAKVYAGTKYIGITPCTYKSKIAESTLTFEKDGYYPTTISTSTKMRGAIWWNLLFTGFIGVLADIPFATKYTNLYYSTNLSAKPQP